MNCKRLPKREPMTHEIYKELIKDAEGPTYINVRTRIALYILVVTGIQIIELLTLKVNQLRTLIENNWIAIDRSNLSLAIIRHFLPRKVRKLFKTGKKDFQLIFLMKEPNAYFFTHQTNHFKKLCHEVITTDVNKIVHKVSKRFPGQPNNSFRVGYITQLWKDSELLLNRS